MPVDQTVESLEKRIIFFVKIFSGTLTIFGIVALGVQIAKFFLEGSWSYSLAFASLLGVFLIILGREKLWQKLVNFCLFEDRKRAKFLVFIIPIFLVLLMALIEASIEPNSWKRMNTEGGFIEYGTSLAYILIIVFAIPIAWYFIKCNRKILGYYYYGVTGFALFICLEELSWGQRFIPVNSPDFFQEYNSKAELSIHNLVWVEQYLYYGFLILGFIGGTSWLLSRAIKWKNKNIYLTLCYLIPSWYLSSFFIIVFSYAFIAKFTGDWGAGITIFVEPIELILSLGFLGFVITNYFRQPLDFDNLMSVAKEKA